MKRGLLAAVLVLVLGSCSKPDYRPEILIVREYFEQSPYRGQVIIMDYSVGGIMTFATFYPYQLNERDALIAHLKRSGRVRYATNFVSELKGDIAP